MLRKIEHFCHYFAEYSNAYALIGGAACTAWYSDHIPSFRGTEDLDIVLILEYMDIQFTETFHDYINRSGYKIRERIDLEQDGVSRKILYRFSEPEDTGAPAQLELLSRKGDALHLVPGQRIVPVKAQDQYTELSCIVLDDTYYHFFREHISRDKGIPRPTIPVLMILKIKACLNLFHQWQQGEAHGSDSSRNNIRKHRNDVFFMLFDVVQETDALHLPEAIQDDVREFLREYQATSPDWQGIFDHLRKRRGSGATTGLTSEDLLHALTGLFYL